MHKTAASSPSFFVSSRSSRPRSRPRPKVSSLLALDFYGCYITYSVFRLLHPHARGPEIDLLPRWRVAQRRQKLALEKKGFSVLLLVDRLPVQKIRLQEARLCLEGWSQTPRSSRRKERILRASFFRLLQLLHKANVDPEDVSLLRRMALELGRVIRKT